MLYPSQFNLTCFPFFLKSTLGYKVGVLPGTFAASYPNTRDALCTERFQKSSPSLHQCDCDMDSESSIKEILIDETKRPSKVMALINEVEMYSFHG